MHISFVLATTAFGEPMDSINALFDAVHLPLPVVYDNVRVGQVTSCNFGPNEKGDVSLSLEADIDDDFAERGLDLQGVVYLSLLHGGANSLVREKMQGFSIDG